MQLREWMVRGQREQLAHSLGISPSQLSRIAHGRAEPSFRLALRICAATDGQVSIEELFPDIEIPPSVRLCAVDPDLADYRSVARLLATDENTAGDGHTGPPPEPPPEPQALSHTG